MAEKSKPRSKDFSPEETNSLVDLIQEKRSKLFGYFDCFLYFRREEHSLGWRRV